jgi:hypothetical protein
MNSSSRALNGCPEARIVPSAWNQGRVLQRADAVRWSVLLASDRSLGLPAIRSRSAPFTSTGGVLVGPHDAGIDLRPPVQIPAGVRVGAQPLLDRRPSAVVFPLREPVVTSFPRPGTLRDLVPLRTVLDPPQDSVDHLAVITPPATTLRKHARQQRLETIPLQISQITSHNTATIDHREP